MIQSQDIRYYEILYSYYYTQSLFKITHFSKIIIRLLKLKQQSLKSINHMKYLSKKRVMRSLTTLRNPTVINKIILSDHFEVKEGVI